MKFFQAGILASLAAIPCLVLADGQAIIDAANQIAETTTQFNETVAGFQGNPLTTIKILVESTKLLSDIKAGTKAASDSAPLTDAEALALVGPTQALVADVQSTLQTVTRKKPVFQRTLTQVVALANLKAEKEASDDFSAAVVAKVPAALQATAQQLVAPLDPAFDAAIAEFQDFF